MFGLGGMCTTVVASEAHYGKVGEIGDICLTNAKIAGHHARLTGDLETDGFMFEEIGFFKCFGEVQFVTTN